MASNDRIILDEVLKQKQSEIAPTTAVSEFFELFTAEQILKDYDLSYDEIETGLVGDGGDGGIDGFFLFVNGEIAQEDPDYTSLKSNVVLDLIIIQSKTEDGFKETPVERFLTVSDDILDLSKDLSTLTVYNDDLIECIDRFRAVHQQLAAKFPAINVKYFYACKGSNPSLSVQRKVEKLKEVVKKYFPSAKFEFSFVGATELLLLARRAPQTTYKLALAEAPISSDKQVSFVCLVKILDFFAFITDENKSLRRQIFEANVRDYQGRTAVNDEILQSLKERNPEDFWWLNNGITILATKASQSGKTLTIENPQIVNGLQSSTEIFNYCKQFNTDNEDRKVLVRVIVPPESESADRIIKATNSQTAVQQASLRATDKIHRDIEEFFRPKGLFYDRRKNFHKNEGQPRDKIVGIPHLAQAVMAIVLNRPDTARARPSSLLKKDEDYEKIYNSKYPIALYYVCAEIARRVEGYLNSKEAGLSSRDRNNLRFYVAMHVALSQIKKASSVVGELSRLDVSKVDQKAIQASLVEVKTLYGNLGGTDQVAKGAELLKDLNGLLGRA